MAITKAYLDPQKFLWIEAQGVILVSMGQITRPGAVLMVDPFRNRPKGGGYEIPLSWLSGLRIWTLPVPQMLAEEGVATCYGGELVLGREIERFLQ